MTVIGYAREDYPIQMSLQTSRLLAYECEQLFIDKRSFDEDKQLQLVLSKLKEDDVLVVESLSVFGKNLAGLITILEQLAKQNVRLVSISEMLDSEKQPDFYEHSVIIFNVISEQRSEYTKQRLEKYRLTGSQLGRPSIDDETIEKMQKLYEEKKMTLREIAAECDVSLGSVHKYVNQRKEI